MTTLCRLIKNPKFNPKKDAALLGYNWIEILSWAPWTVGKKTLLEAFCLTEHGPTFFAKEDLEFAWGEKDGGGEPEYVVDPAWLKTRGGVPG